MIKIAVSSCLMGQPVRYDGGSAASADPILERWRSEGRILLICPETAAGMSTPRAPAEIAGAKSGGEVLAGRALVIAQGGDDVTRLFVRGACRSLMELLDAGVQVAVLKERSPSCGVNWTHDGSFSGGLVPGSGVTAALLTQSGIRVFNEHELREADEYVRSIEGRDGERGA